MMERAWSEVHVVDILDRNLVQNKGTVKPEKLEFNEAVQEEAIYKEITSRWNYDGIRSGNIYTEKIAQIRRQN